MTTACCNGGVDWEILMVVFGLKWFLADYLRGVMQVAALYCDSVRYAQVRVWSIKTAYREILLGENFKILSRFARRLGHMRTQGTAIVGLSENRENQSSLYAVFLYHTLTSRRQRPLRTYFSCSICKILFCKKDDCQRPYIERLNSKE